MMVKNLSGQIISVKSYKHVNCVSYKYLKLPTFVTLHLVSVLVDVVSDCLGHDEAAAGVGRRFVVIAAAHYVHKTGTNIMIFKIFSPEKLGFRYKDSYLMSKGSLHWFSRKTPIFCRK
jgi:hypothetical protein